MILLKNDLRIAPGLCPGDVESFFIKKNAILMTILKNYILLKNGLRIAPGPFPGDVESFFIKQLYKIDGTSQK